MLYYFLNQMLRLHQLHHVSKAKHIFDRFLFGMEGYRYLDQNNKEPNEKTYFFSIRENIVILKKDGFWRNNL